MKYLTLILAALLPLTLSAQTKLSDLIEGTTIVATDLIPFVDVSDTTQAASGSTKKAQAGVLASQLAQLIAPTWNNGATDFTALKVNVTNTASGAGSKLAEWQVGGVSKAAFTLAGGLEWEGSAIQPANSPLILGRSGGTSYGVVKAGSGGFYIEVSTANAAHVRLDGIALGSTSSYSFTSGAVDGTRDVFLVRHAANILAQRNGTNPQESRLYNTYDGTNDEWFSAKWDSNVLKLGTYASGTGTVRTLQIFLDSSNTIYTDASIIAARCYTGTFQIQGHLGADGTSLDFGYGGHRIVRGSGTPEASVTAIPGSLYMRNNSGSGELWLKTSGTGNTGWKAAQTQTTTKTTGVDYTIGTTNPNELYGGVIYVTGAATITVPAVASGASFTVITVGAVAVSVDPNASDLIYLDGTALSDGDKITNLSTAGDIAVFTYYDGTGWYASTNGWTDGN